MKNALILLVVLTALVQPGHARSLFASVSDVVEARAQASDADRTAAREMLRIADQAAGRGNWSGAYKGYAEAALRWPDARALLGMAQSLSLMKRGIDGCENGYRVKLSDLSYALGILVLVQQLDEIDGIASDTSPARNAISAALSGVSDEIDACRQD